MSDRGSLNNGEYLLQSKLRPSDSAHQPDWFACTQECLGSHRELSQAEQLCMTKCARRRNLFLPKMLEL
jgi:hypothetical protein